MSGTREREWLQSLKVGDEVAVFWWGSFRGRYEFLVITGETPTRWRIAGMEFNKSDGTGRKLRARLVEPSSELKTRLKDEADKRDLSDRLNSVRWSSLDLNVLRQVDALIDALVSDGLQR